MQYQVIGQCANFSVTFPDGRRGRQLLFKGQLVPATATQAEIDHHLSIKAIVPVAGLHVAEPSVEETRTVADPSSEPEQSAEPDGELGGEPVQGDNPQDLDGDSDPDQADADQKWADADTKAQALVDSGSKPDGRSNPLVIAAFLVHKGYDRSAVEKADKKDLLDLVNSVGG